MTKLQSWVALHASCKNQGTWNQKDKYKTIKVNNEDLMNKRGMHQDVHQAIKSFGPLTDGKLHVHTKEFHRCSNEI